MNSELSLELRNRVAECIAEKNEYDFDNSKVQVKDTWYIRHGKRVLDIIVSLVALTVTAPINLIMAIVTYFDVGSPIFFRQERTGKDGKIFEIVKFRNMRNTVDKNGMLLSPNQRVTRWGKFVRRTSLDELLNFISILKGDMTIIGPRPLLPEYVNRYSERHRARLSMRPGLECPPYEGVKRLRTWQEQFENDIWYVEHASFLVDCKMLIRLVQFAFSRDNSAARGRAVTGFFIGYDQNGCAISLNQVSQELIKEICEEKISSEILDHNDDASSIA